MPASLSVQQPNNPLRRRPLPWTFQGQALLWWPWNPRRHPPGDAVENGTLRPQAERVNIVSGSSFGKNFAVTTWGESHGPALGAVVDGCPAGIPLTVEDIQSDLNRRRPGQSAYATPRKEPDRVEILSGVFEGRTTGTPISLIIYSTNQRPRDYSQIAQFYRPGHADYTYDAKYGFRDYRGGGRSSGRETGARVAAGAVARKLLQQFDIVIKGYTQSIGPVGIDHTRFDRNEILRNPVAMPDSHAAQRAMAFLDQCRAEEDSAGGVVVCEATGLPPGLGEPVFEKLDAVLARALFSIGAVKAVEVGSGTAAPAMTGSQHNDFYRVENGDIVKETNHAGGILGGISDGSPLLLRAHFKPTPSIHQSQRTASKQGAEQDIQIEGRHDPIIVPRAVVVVEAMTALTLADYLLQRVLSDIALLRRALSKQA